MSDREVVRVAIGGGREALDVGPPEGLDRLCPTWTG